MYRGMTTATDFGTAAVGVAYTFISGGGGISRVVQRCLCVSMIDLTIARCDAVRRGAERPRTLHVREMSNLWSGSGHSKRVTRLRADALSLRSSLMSAL